MRHRWHAFAAIAVIWALAAYAFDSKVDAFCSGAFFAQAVWLRSAPKPRPVLRVQTFINEIDGGWVRVETEPDSPRVVMHSAGWHEVPTL